MKGKLDAVDLHTDLTDGQICFLIYGFLILDFDSLPEIWKDKEVVRSNWYEHKNAILAEAENGLGPWALKPGKKPWAYYIFEVDPAKWPTEEGIIYHGGWFPQQFDAQGKPLFLNKTETFVSRIHTFEECISDLINSQRFE